MTGEDLLERKPREHRTGGKEAERNQHHHRTLMRLAPVLAVVRLAVERLEDQSPGIKRREQCRDDCANEAVKGHRILADEGSLDDRILREVSGREWEAGQRQRADQ